MRILVDDLKDGYAPDIICRSVKAAKKVLLYVQADLMFLDFDLGDGRGDALLLWLAQKDRHMLPKEVVIVSTLPNGIRSLEATLTGLGYKFDGVGWHRT